MAVLSGCRDLQAPFNLWSISSGSSAVSVDEAGSRSFRRPVLHHSHHDLWVGNSKSKCSAQDVLRPGTILLGYSNRRRSGGVPAASWDCQGDGFDNEVDSFGFSGTISWQSLVPSGLNGRPSSSWAHSAFRNERSRSELPQLGISVTRPGFRAAGHRGSAAGVVRGDAETTISKDREQKVEEEEEEVGSRTGWSGDVSEIERQVAVEVEAVSWRERQIRASVCVEAGYETIWEILTSYERLVEFIPNLVRSERIPCPNPDRVWLLQHGVQSAMYWHIEARVVLDLEELPNGPPDDDGDSKELRFLMVDGDFKHYKGRWYLQPGPRPGTTNLHYEVNFTPKLFFPAAFLERIIKADLPVNLLAIARRAETDPSQWDSILHPSKRSFKQKAAPSPLLAYLHKLTSGGSPTSYSATSPSSSSSSAPPFSFPDAPVLSHPPRAISTSLQHPPSPSTLAAAEEEDEFKKDMSLNGFELDMGGLSSDDESGGGGGDGNRIMWKLGDKAWFSTKSKAQSSQDMGGPCTVDEVHLRRLDDLLERGGVHRRVVAAITVESPSKHVWSVLTDYERLSDFIPNLASCKILSRTKDRHVRLVQEGCKCVMFMVLHATAVLDLWEKPENKIVFQQVEGDFASLQGQWTLEPLGSQHTLLKYVVDIKMHKHCVLAEPIIEEVTYVDLPANLIALRKQVELLHKSRTASFLNDDDSGDEVQISSPTSSSPSSSVVGKKISKEQLNLRAAGVELSSGSTSTSTSSSSAVEKQQQQQQQVLRAPGKRFRVAGLQRDFRVLEEQLFAFIREHGEEGSMPMRSKLRELKRVDLEKAICGMGGFRSVALRLNLSQQRRPRGYWDHFQNLRQEIVLFQAESGMDREYMPTRNSLNRAGRHDVARALEKWGGIREVARLMGLQVRRGRLCGLRQSLPAAESEDLDMGESENREGVDSTSSSVTEDNDFVTPKPFKGVDSTSSSVTEDNEFVTPKPFKISLPPKPTKWVNLKREDTPSDREKV